MLGKVWLLGRWLSYSQEVKSLMFASSLKIPVAASPRPPQKCLLGSHTYSVRALCLRRLICRLSVCPASDLEN